MRVLELRRILDEEFGKPYVPGASDCLFLAFRVADELAGTKFVEQHAGKYDSVAGGNRALKRSGYGSLAGVFEEHLERAAPALAAMGDVVIVERDGRQHAGVCLGQRFVSKTENGRVYYDLSEVRTAFRTERRS